MESPGIASIQSSLYSAHFLHLLQNQTKCLGLKRVFNLDSLPVGFASHLSVLQDGTIDWTPLSNAVNKLAEVIWKRRGFGFWHRRTDWDYSVYTYFCSQDAERVPRSVTKGQRDVQRTCQSDLTFRPSLVDHTLVITLRHTYHRPYMDSQISAAVQKWNLFKRGTLCPPLLRYMAICKERSYQGGSLQPLSKSIISGNSRTRVYGDVTRIHSSQLRISIIYLFSWEASLGTDKSSLPKASVARSPNVILNPSLQEAREFRQY